MGWVWCFALSGGFWGFLGWLGGGFLGWLGGVIQYLVSLECMFWGVLRIQPPGHGFWALTSKRWTAGALSNSSRPGTTCRKQLRAWLWIPAGAGGFLAAVGDAVGGLALRVPFMRSGWVGALAARTGLYRLGLPTSCISGVKGAWVGSAQAGRRGCQASSASATSPRKSAPLSGRKTDR